MKVDAVLARFGRITQEWFRSTFPAPTPAQAGGWESISSGRDTLVVAPTGSGKTLAAFLWSLDRIAGADPPPRPERLRVLYVSPLKALAADIERNLRSPLSGLRAAAHRLGEAAPEVAVAVRTGDTPAADRRRFATAPPDILITTPESLYLLLTSRARAALAGVQTVIVDEVHALAATKRGAHLALSLERLDALTGSPAQRIGLSATVRPVADVARWLGGEREVAVVEAPYDKRFDVRVVVPVRDMTELGEPLGNHHDGPAVTAEARRSIWPHVEERLLELVRAHTSTIVFANSRRLAERLCSRLNELAAAPVARAHHGSVSKEQRRAIEEELKSGRLPAVVATSSLELGIDMGDVDLVVQVESPPSVGSALQRIGRAGHQVGAVSRGVVFPKYRGDLVSCAVVVERMRAGAIEESAPPRNPLDVLAQQIVAMVAVEDWVADDLYDLVRRSAPFAALPRSAFDGVLDMLAGRYPSDEFAEFRPRIVWDRVEGRVRARPGAQRLAVTSGGTIPDRGLYGVFLAGGERGRVGELDEEMVYESRPGETFVLGATSWLIEDITRDRVVVTPAPGRPGKMPFWHGDAPARPVELGRALGAFVAEVAGLDPAAAGSRLSEAGLDDWAAANLVSYVRAQKEATGALPDHRTVVVERFRDELGDWRVCILSPLGARVHGPWAQAIEARVRADHGVEVQTIHTDDGIVVRVPEAQDAPPSSWVVFEPDEVEDLVVSALGSSALFASRFRECAARALLLPRRSPGGRTPLWQQRQRSATLLAAASRYPGFPIMLETYRECLQDVFDVPALVALMAGIRSRAVRVVEVDTEIPSPFASSLQLGFVGAFLYEGDAPVAERRAQALSLDRSLLAEIMGRDELRELVDPGALADLELELQRLSPGRKARTPDDLHDVLRTIGDLTAAEAAARCDPAGAAASWLAGLRSQRRAVAIGIAGEDRWIAIEDCARVRDALGTALPVGVPNAFLEPVTDAVGDLVGRFARTHGPFRPDEPARRLGLGVAVVEGALARLAHRGAVAEGEFRPGASGREWIDAGVLRRLRRRSLAAFRREVEPAPPGALARFGLAWHGLNAPRPATADSVYEVVEQLQGCPVPASALERLVLGGRLNGYSPALLDELGAAGEIVWSGAGALGPDDGWICLATAAAAPLVLPEPALEPSETAARVRDVLAERGALFFRQIADAVGPADDTDVLLALWELAWGGWATSDTLAPVRAVIAKTRPRAASGGRRRPALPSRLGPPAGAGRWSLVVERTSSPTRRLHAAATQLLTRHGILTRGALATERIAGGFAALYPVLKALEEGGRTKRGYFVEGLGGAQFALAGAVDRMRSLAERGRDRRAYVVAAADPANPYGAALPWPERDGHRAGRKAGAVVVLVDGELVLYVERGGRTLLSFSEDPDDLAAAAAALASSARVGALGRLDVERADGGSVLDTPLGRSLEAAGFRPSAHGLRMRA